MFLKPMLLHPAENSPLPWQSGIVHSRFQVCQAHKNPDLSSLATLQCAVPFSLEYPIPFQFAWPLYPVQAYHSREEDQFDQ